MTSVGEFPLGRKPKKKNLSPAGNDMDKFGRQMAKLRKVKNRLIEASMEGDDVEFAVVGIALCLTHMKLMREGVEAQIRENDFHPGMTRERAQEAIYAMQLMEAELLAAPWERPH